MIWNTVVISGLVVVDLFGVDIELKCQITYPAGLAIAVVFLPFR